MCVCPLYAVIVRPTEYFLYMCVCVYCKLLLSDRPQSNLSICATGCLVLLTSVISGNQSRLLLLS